MFEEWEARKVSTWENTCTSYITARMDIFKCSHLCCNLFLICYKDQTRAWDPAIHSSLLLLAEVEVIASFYNQNYVPVVSFCPFWLLLATWCSTS